MNKLQHCARAPGDTPELLMRHSSEQRREKKNSLTRSQITAQRKSCSSQRSPGGRSGSPCRAVNILQGSARCSGVQSFSDPSICCAVLQLKLAEPAPTSDPLVTHGLSYFGENDFILFCSFKQCCRLPTAFFFFLFSLFHSESREKNA